MALQEKIALRLVLWRDPNGLLFVKTDYNLLIIHYK